MIDFNTETELTTEKVSELVEEYKETLDFLNDEQNFRKFLGSKLAKHLLEKPNKKE